MSIPVILKLDAGGLPVGWIHWQTAVTLYARKRVCWEAGEERFPIAGGVNARTGERSQFDIGSIIAVADRSKRFSRGEPLLTNRTLFQRDHNLCLYCGEQYNPAHLTRDHVMPANITPTLFAMVNTMRTPSAEQLSHWPAQLRGGERPAPRRPPSRTPGRRASARRG